MINAEIREFENDIINYVNACESIPVDEASCNLLRTFIKSVRASVREFRALLSSVGDSDEPMTEYEVYSYEAYRKKYQDDIRGVQRATSVSYTHLDVYKRQEEI